MSLPSRFQFQVTDDGSLTLSDSGGEWMHSRQGAFAETTYVYGAAIERVLQMSGNSFVCVGLGLGYIEMLLAAYALRERTEFLVRSFESEPALFQGFRSWIRGDFPGQDDRLLPVLDGIAHRTACALDVSPDRLKQKLADWHESGSWSLEPALTAGTPWLLRYQGLFYDPFSSETAPGLWSQRFLEEFLQAAAAPRCVFASYAATGDLQRALERSRFRNERRPGFAGKRECTLAHRP